jgi:tripartite-type tricarboxylate transporter receptor subunit TctC
MSIAHYAATLTGKIDPGWEEPSMVRLIELAALALAASLQLSAGAAAQQTFPTRTVRFILPFGAASASDTAARLFADRLSGRWGKPVVVENRPGGDGLVSLDAFVGAHDDHTMWFGPAGTFNVLPYQHDTLPFDPKRDLNPIASVSEVVLAISTPVSMNVETVDQLVAMARAQPGKLNAAAAQGISDFLLFGFIKSVGLEIVRVPYRDIMQAPNDLAESRIQVLSTSLAVVQPLSKAGRIKVLAVTSRQRAPSMPDVPTAAEAGYPALTFESIGGVFGPRSMPDKLRESIAADFQKVAKDPIIAQRLGDTGQIMSVLGPAEFGARVQEQRDKLAALAKTLGLKAAQ